MNVRSALRCWRSAHPTVLGARGNQLGVLFKQGKIVEAESQLRAMIPPMLESFGAGHPGVVSMQQNLGLVLLDQRKFDEAEAVMRASLEDAIGTMGEDHVKVARWRTDLAGVLLELQRAEDALSFAEASWARYESGKAGSPHERGVSALTLAEVYAATGRTDDARRIANEAKTLFASEPEPNEESLAKVAALLDAL